MRFRRTRDTELAARVQLFVKGPATATRFDGRTPNLLLIGAMKLRTSETVEDNHSTMTQYWLPWFLLCVAPENPEGAFRSP